MKFQKLGKILLSTLIAIILLVSALPASAALKADAIPYGTPQIDGKLDDIWSGASNKIAIDMFFSGEKTNYATGYARLMWDESFLYVLGYAYDTTKSTKVATEQWETDGFEVFLDETNAHNTVKNDLSQFRVTRSGELSGMLMSKPVPEERVLAEYKGTKWAAAEASDGYFTELAIPWTRAQNVKAAKQIGIEFQLNDDFNNDGITDTIINSEVIDKWQTVSYRMLTLVATKATAASSASSENTEATSNVTSTVSKPVTNNTSVAESTPTSSKDTASTESVVDNTTTESENETTSDVNNDVDNAVDEKGEGIPKGIIIVIIVVVVIIVAAIIVCLMLLLKPKKKNTEDK